MDMLKLRNCDVTVWRKSYFLNNMEEITKHCKAAVLACLYFVMQNGCGVADNLVNDAFAGGSLKCLKYVHETLNE